MATDYDIDASDVELDAGGHITEPVASGISSTRIAALLTELLHADPQAIYFLLTAHAPATRALLDHPTVVVDEPIPGYSGNVVRWLGILQAIGAMDGHHIAAVYDDETHKLIRFDAILRNS